MKVDLHTHSSLSQDGNITEEAYKKTLSKNILDVVAITDHNKIDFAKALWKKLGNAIIVGEEIMTTQGEVIGLFLSSAVLPKLSPLETMRAIKKQKGLVYIPHPFEHFRRGLTQKILKECLEYIDIIEVKNGRAFLDDQSKKAGKFAKDHNLLQGAGSDAHSLQGIGKTYTEVKNFKDSKTFLSAMRDAKIVYSPPPFMAFLDPKINKIKKLL